MIKKQLGEQIKGYYDLSFRELCDMLDITPLQRAKLAKWIFGKYEQKKSKLK